MAVGEGAQERSVAMSKRRVWLVLLVMAAIGACWVGQAVSQEADQGERERRMAEFRKRMEEYRARRETRMRESLGATEAEWKVLQPLIEKVQQQQRQGRSRGMMMMGRGDRGPRGGRGDRGDRGDRGGTPRARPAGTPERERSDVEKKSEALRTLLADEAAKPKAIAAALAALRKARAKAAADLATARKALREVVTSRQEAQLVLMSILD